MLLTFLLVDKISFIYTPKIVSAFCVPTHKGAGLRSQLINGLTFRLGSFSDVIAWVLENMKNSDTNIYSIIETKMNGIIDKINKMESIIETDPLDSELRI